MDTQWPRWEVFEQEKPGEPFRNAGSVHAPDAELALENARDVFVRRPRCAGLWVVPAEAIYSRTAQELAAEPLAAALDEPEAGDQTYLVFQKQSQRAAETFVTYVGEVKAGSPQAALARARADVAVQAAYVWWVCPAELVTASQAGDEAPLFAPAESKPFRHPQFYKVVSQLREIKAAGGSGPS